MPPVTFPFFVANSECEALELSRATLVIRKISMKFTPSMLMLGAAVSLGGLTAAAVPTLARAACAAQTSTSCAGKTGACAGQTGACAGKAAPCAAKCKAN